MQQDDKGIWRDHNGKLITPPRKEGDPEARQNVYLVDMSRDGARHLGTFRSRGMRKQNAVIMVEDLEDYILNAGESPLTASEDARLYGTLFEYSCDESFAAPVSWDTVFKYPYDFKVCKLTRIKGGWQNEMDSAFLGKPHEEIFKMPTPASLAEVLDKAAKEAGIVSAVPPPKPFLFTPPPMRKEDMIELPIELVSGLLMMLGGKVRLDWADLVAAEQVRDGREIVWSMSRDPANYRIYIKE